MSAATEGAKARRDEKAAAADRERAKRRSEVEPRPPQRIATDYIHTTRKDGVDVVFVPGEALPDWVQIPE